MVISYFKKNFGSESYIDFFKKRNKEPENNNIRQQEEKIRRNENRVCNICKQKGHTAKFCNNRKMYIYGYTYHIMNYNDCFHKKLSKNIFEKIIIENINNKR